MSGRHKLAIGGLIAILVGAIVFVAARGRTGGSGTGGDGLGAARSQHESSLSPATGLESPLASSGGPEAQAASQRTAAQAVESGDTRPGTIAGILRGPVGDDSLVLIDEQRRQSADAKPDAAGAFRFEGVVPGRYRFAMSTPDRKLTPDAWIDVAPAGEIVGLRLTIVDVVALVVRVERPDGRPAEHALVRVLTSVGEVLEEDHSDSRGSVRFPSLTRGQRVRVEAGLESGERAESALPVPLVEPRVEIVLRLSAPVSVAGVVTDPDGRPVSGAMIQVYRKPLPSPAKANERFKSIRSTKEIEVLSDEGGRFELPKLSVGSKVLIAAHRRWAAEAVSFDARDRSLSIAFSKPGKDLQLFVRGATTPIAGATVSLLPRAPADRPVLLQPATDRLPMLVATTDAQGSVVFSSLHEGKVELCVEAPGAVPAFFTRSVPLVESQELRVGVGTIEVHIGRGETPLERPVALELENLDADERRSMFAQERQAVFEGLALGTWLLRAEDARSASFEELVLLRMDANKVVVEVTLVESQVVRGTVRSSTDQAPIVGAEITLEPMDAGGESSAHVRTAHSTSSRAGGQFELDMPPGYFLVRAEAPRFSPSRGVALELLPDAPPPESLDILLTPAAELTGVVRDGSGQSLSHRLVSAIGRSASEPRYAETAADGSFAFSELGADLVRVAVEPSYTRFVELSAGQSMFLEIVLSEGRDLEGTVLLSGEPAVGWKTRLIVTEGGLDVRISEIDGDGKFRLPNLPPGTHDLYVVQGEQQLRSCHHQSVTIGQETPAPLHIDVPVLNVWGRVTTAAGEPTYAFVLWRRVTQSAYRAGSLGEVASRGMPYSLRTGADGKYTIPVIAPGEYEVFAINESFGTVWDSRQLRESGEQPDLVLQNGGGVMVDVVDSVGSAVAGAWGVLRKSAQEAPSSPLIRQADSTGRLSFQQVPFGSYELVVQKKGYAQARAPLNLRESAGDPMRVVLRGENQLVVNVHGADTKPVANAVVLVRDSGGILALPVAVEDGSSGFAWFNRTNADGLYKVPNLGEGEFRVEVIAPDGRKAEEAVSLSGTGQTRTVELVVK